MSIALDGCVNYTHRLIEAILTRPNLNQIDFYDHFKLDSNMQQGFQKSVTVEEITLKNGSRTGLSGLDLELWKQLFDALPNTKRVRIVFNWNAKNVLEFLKIISDFKNLESLNFAIRGLKNSGVQKMQDCCNIIDNFPIRLDTGHFFHISPPQGPLF